VHPYINIPWRGEHPSLAPLAEGQGQHLLRDDQVHGGAQHRQRGRAVQVDLKLTAIGSRDWSWIMMNKFRTLLSINVRRYSAVFTTVRNDQEQICVLILHGREV
jgi:hypothetical protein